jgi:hypothetical protein
MVLSIFAFNARYITQLAFYRFAAAISSSKSKYSKCDSVRLMMTAPVSLQLPP